MRDDGVSDRSVPKTLSKAFRVLVVCDGDKTHQEQFLESVDFALFENETLNQIEGRKHSLVGLPSRATYCTNTAGRVIPVACEAGTSTD